MKQAEGMISSMVYMLKKDYIVKYINSQSEEINIDFTPPYKVFDMVKDLEVEIDNTIFANFRTKIYSNSMHNYGATTYF